MSWKGLVTIECSLGCAKSAVNSFEQANKILLCHASIVTGDWNMTTSGNRILLTQHSLVTRPPPPSWGKIWAQRQKESILVSFKSLSRTVIVLQRSVCNPKWMRDGGVCTNNRRYTLLFTQGVRLALHGPDYWGSGSRLRDSVHWILTTLSRYRWMDG